MPTTGRFNKTFLTVFLGLGICMLMMQPVDVQKIDFDHDFETGFLLTGEHLIASCDDCHASGIFKGTPRQCSRC